MRVRQIYTRDVSSCTPDDTLAHAASLMWNRDCGFIPVVEHQGRVVGILTDRDIAIAAGTQNRRTGEMPVREVMSRNLRTCRPEDDLETALDTMAYNQVRRLVVTDETGVLRGVLSLGDFLPWVGDPDGPTADRIIAVLASICEPSQERLSEGHQAA